MATGGELLDAAYQLADAACVVIERLILPGGTYYDIEAFLADVDADKEVGQCTLSCKLGPELLEVGQVARFEVAVCVSPEPDRIGVNTVQAPPI